MKASRIIMGMPITIDILDAKADPLIIEKVFQYFDYVDHKFSTYKEDSEISKINRKEINSDNFSEDMQTVLRLSEETKKQTNGYFNITKPDGSIDPSGLVKGWSIYIASKILDQEGLKNYYLEAGGDIQVLRPSRAIDPWKIGIRNPFKREEIVKVVHLFNEGIATSGTYIRGQHIYDPHQPQKELNDIVSISVIGKNIYDTDRFATAAFAMGAEGINFIEKLQGFEAYQIDKNGIATQTSQFEKYIK